MKLVNIFGLLFLACACFSKKQDAIIEKRIPEMHTMWPVEAPIKVPERKIKAEFLPDGLTTATWYKAYGELSNFYRPYTWKDYYNEEENYLRLCAEDNSKAIDVYDSGYGPVAFRLITPTKSECSGPKVHKRGTIVKESEFLNGIKLGMSKQEVKRILGMKELLKSETKNSLAYELTVDIRTEMAIIHGGQVYSVDFCTRYPDGLCAFAWDLKFKDGKLVSVFAGHIYDQAFHTHHH